VVDRPLSHERVRERNAQLSYHSIHKRVRDTKARGCEQFADLEQSSVRNDIFLEADSYLKLVYEEHLPFVEIKP